eukprot:scaffold259668_cov19-Tisochrysis_lutea.AAC.1
MVSKEVPPSWHVIHQLSLTVDLTMRGLPPETVPDLLAAEENEEYKELPAVSAGRHDGGRGRGPIRGGRPAVCCSSFDLRPLAPCKAAGTPGTLPGSCN